MDTEQSRFTDAMRRLLQVPKAALDAELAKHRETKPERASGQKPKSN